MTVIGLLANFRPPVLYKNYDKNYDKTELGTKVGKSSLQSILWFVSWGDAGTRAAAENGAIEIIRHADVEYFMVFLGFYTRITTVVYGD